MRERDVEEAIELSPNMAAALIAGAQEESREELAELWARLLANAMDPNMNTVRHSFIEAVKQMDPMDAVVLRFMYGSNIRAVRAGRLDNAVHGTTGIENIATEIGRRNDEVEASIRHLQSLMFFDGEWYSNAISREFLRACYPEVKTE